MDANTYIALGAFFVSACALILAISEGKANRKHYRLSVKPNLSFTWTDIGEKIDVSINNNGLGAAIIRYFTVSFDNEETSHTDWDSAFKACDFTYEEGTHYSSLYPKESLAVSEKMLLLKIVFKDEASRINSEIFSKLVVDITYESMYGEQFKILLKNDRVVI